MSMDHLKISEVIRPETVDLHMDQIVNKDQAIQYLVGLLDNSGKSPTGYGLTSDQQWWKTPAESGLGGRYYYQSRHAKSDRDLDRQEKQDDLDK